MMDTNFKNWMEQEWKRDMGQPNQLDNPTFDQHSAPSKEDHHNDPRNADHEATDNIHALGNHLRALNRLVMRVSKSKKFFGLESDLNNTFEEFKGKMEKLMAAADERKVQQPQVGDTGQGVPLNQQINPEMAEKLKDEQPPRHGDPSQGRPS
jgi:hypothetical protein